MQSTGLILLLAAGVIVLFGGASPYSGGAPLQPVLPHSEIFLR